MGCTPLVATKIPATREIICARICDQQTHSLRISIGSAASASRTRCSQNVNNIVIAGFRDSASVIQKDNQQFTQTCWTELFDYHAQKAIFHGAFLTSSLSRATIPALMFLMLHSMATGHNCNMEDYFQVRLQSACTLAISDQSHGWMIERSLAQTGCRCRDTGNGAVSASSDSENKAYPASLPVFTVKKLKTQSHSSAACSLRPAGYVWQTRRCPLRLCSGGPRHFSKPTVDSAAAATETASSSKYQPDQ